MDLGRSWIPIRWALAVTVVVMGAVALAAAVLDESTRMFMSDPAALSGFPFYTGATTLFRTGLLSMAVGAGGLTWWLLRRTGTREVEFLGVFTAFCLFLVLDDKYQGHETLNRHLGVPELLVFGVMGVVALYGLYRYWRIVLAHPEGGSLVVAMGLFGTAVVADAIPTDIVHSYWETSAEVAGIVIVAFFTFRWCADLLRRHAVMLFGTAEAEQEGARPLPG
jgi:hypothetical protein